MGPTVASKVEAFKLNSESPQLHPKLNLIPTSLKVQHSKKKESTISHSDYSRQVKFKLHLYLPGIVSAQSLW